jgi:hypothetical protein
MQIRARIRPEMGAKTPETGSAGAGNGDFGVRSVEMAGSTAGGPREHVGRREKEWQRVTEAADGPENYYGHSSMIPRRSRLGLRVACYRFPAGSLLP